MISLFCKVATLSLIFTTAFSLTSYAQENKHTVLQNFVGEATIVENTCNSQNVGDKFTMEFSTTYDSTNNGIKFIVTDVASPNKKIAPQIRSTLVGLSTSAVIHHRSGQICANPSREDNDACGIMNQLTILRGQNVHIDDEFINFLKRPAQEISLSSYINPEKKRLEATRLELNSFVLQDGKPTDCTISVEISEAYELLNNRPTKGNENYRLVNREFKTTNLALETDEDVLELLSRNGMLPGLYLGIPSSPRSFTSEMEFNARLATDETELRDAIRIFRHREPHGFSPDEPQLALFDGPGSDSLEVSVDGRRVYIAAGPEGLPPGNYLLTIPAGTIKFNSALKKNIFGDTTQGSLDEAIYKAIVVRDN